jgi:glycerophosphoryl diester phosphodiesterase
MGFRYIETDVRATRDGVPFIFHDKNLSRMTGCDRAFNELDAREVRQLTLPRGEVIPTLREALEAFPNLRFNLDLKEDAAVEPVVEVLEGIKAQQRVCVTSFSERRVAAARRRLGPSVCTGLGITGAIRMIVGSVLPSLHGHRKHAAAVIQLPLEWMGLALLTPATVARCHDAGLAVHAWTLNDRAAISKALDAGVDGVMTDTPELLKEVLTSRGLWERF